MKIPSTTSLYIFDLDGTLADTTHRHHLISGPPNDRDWTAFSEACDKDTPILPTIQTLMRLARSGAEVQIWTGRSESVRRKTFDWLREVECRGTRPPLEFLTTFHLKMRPEKDHRPDTELKAKWYLELDLADKNRLVAVFEDRSRMVQMWRELGVTCYQVANGNF